MKLFSVFTKTTQLTKLWKRLTTAKKFIVCNGPKTSHPITKLLSLMSVQPSDNRSGFTNGLKTRWLTSIHKLNTNMSSFLMFLVIGRCKTSLVAEKCFMKNCTTVNVWNLDVQNLESFKNWHIQFWWTNDPTS